MRPSKRSEIIAAALRVVERDGVNAVTYESVAAEAGLTKGGLVYHFPSRESLLVALQQHLADAWELALVDAAGKAVEETSAQERSAAYARVAATSATRAELLLVLEAAIDTAQATPWTRLMGAWAPPVPTAVPLSDEDADRLIAYLAADGLWVFDAITGTPLPADVRARLSERILHLTRQSSHGTESAGGRGEPADADPEG